jgi:membrane-anchored glycerophosphoryl diester phosphodiesterase (GDPDase)
MRENGKVFRKYVFLPIVFSIASLFLVKIPGFGLGLAAVFDLLPGGAQSFAMFWMLLGFWVNLKICLAFPALAMDHPGSVWDNVKASFEWTNGLALKIIGSFLLCYTPVLFFTVMMMQIPGVMPDKEDFFGSLPQLIFSDLLIIFSMLWSSIVLARIYREVTK